MFVNYAHRGASSYYPENTLSAFFAGLDLGANGIETDIHKTKDGVLVLFHDDELERVTDGKGNISDYTYEELLQLSVHNQEGSRIDRIVSFEDFLKYFAYRDLTFAIELKQDHVEKETIDMLEKYAMREKTILTSFNFESISNAKKYNPDYRVGYLYEADETNALEKLQSINGEEICPEARLISREDVEYWHSLGLSVRPWGIYNQDIMKQMCEYGVDGMTVNFPDLLTIYRGGSVMAYNGKVNL